MPQRMMLCGCVPSMTGVSVPNCRSGCSTTAMGRCHEALSVMELGTAATVGRMMRGSQLPASNGAAGSRSCSSVGPVVPSPMSGRGKRPGSVASGAPGVSGPSGMLSNCSSINACEGPPAAAVPGAKGIVATEVPARGARRSGC